MSTLFAAKAAPTADKLRGGYYTPVPVARFLARWVSGAGTRTLEPSCGDGAILAELVDLGDPVGVELVAEEAVKARENSGAAVVTGDFFQWLTNDKYGYFDGVAGNPPYIRFGNWAEEYRAGALRLMKDLGLKPSRLTNAWVPFVVGSVVAVRDGGRVGLVVPAELLQVGYASELRAFLVDSCSDITVVSFSELIFPGVLQEVVLLMLTKGGGPAEIRTVEVANAKSLESVSLEGVAIRAPLHASEKWTKYFLDVEQIETLRELRLSNKLHPLREFASVNVGVVTGRNSFFCLTAESVHSLNLQPYVKNLLSRSAQLRSVRYTANDHASDVANGAKSHLLSVTPQLDLAQHRDLAAYVALGEEEGVHLGYKCSIRPVWWSVPSVSVPDGFMLRQVTSVLRLTSNRADATSTDTVHRVFVRDGVDMDKLAVAALNSITLAMSEIMGRSYGGGLLEIEPREGTALPVPAPALVSDEDVERVDTLLREGRVDDAIDYVDSTVLVESCGFSAAQISCASEAARHLRERRLRRGRKASKR